MRGVGCGWWVILRDMTRCGLCFMLVHLHIRPMFDHFLNSLYTYSNSELVTFHVNFNKPTCSPFLCSQSLEVVL